MSSRPLTVLSLTLAAFSVACGPEAPEPDATPPRPAEEVMATEPGVLDACVLLRSMDLTPYLGGPAVSFTESARSLQSTAGLTMCGASPARGVPVLTVMLRWGPKNADPRSIDNWIKTEFGADTLEMGAPQVSAMRAGEVIPELGDFAVGYALGGVRVAAWWAPHRHLTATASRFSDKVLARQAVEAVAREAIHRY